MRSKRSIYNLITSVGSQIVLLILGMIVPRLTLSNYGSETNGYMNLVSQVYIYIALLEAGLGAAETQALYAPVSAGDQSSVSMVVNTAKQYYHKLAISYSGVVLCVALVLPLAVMSELRPWEMIVYFCLFGLPRIANFFFTQHYRTLMSVEGKNYISTTVNLCVTLLSTFTRIALLWRGVPLIPLQVAYTAINLLEVLFYFCYVQRNYRWIDRSIPADPSALKQRDAFFVQQVCSLVYSCTDIVLLSMFCGLKTTSVYAVYMLIYNAIGTVLSNITESIKFMVGQIYHEDFARYQKLHRLYEFALVGLAFLLYSITYVLALPFVRLYTQGIHDADYLVAAIPFLLSLNACLLTCRTANEGLINIAYHIKPTLWHIIAEAGLNLIISVLLVRPLGIVGVLLGTGIAGILRLVLITLYSSKHVIFLPAWRSFWLYGVSFAVYLGIVLCSSQFHIVLQSYLDFIRWGILVTVCVTAIYALVYLITQFAFVRDLTEGAMNRLHRWLSR